VEMEVNPGVTDSLESFGFRSVRLPGRLGSIPTVAEGGCDRALVALSYVGLPWRGSDCLPEFTKISRDCHPLFSPRLSKRTSLVECFPAPSVSSRPWAVGSEVRSYNPTPTESRRGDEREAKQPHEHEQSAAVTGSRIDDRRVPDQRGGCV